MSDFVNTPNSEPSFLRESRFAAAPSISLYVYQIPSAQKQPKGILFFGHGMVEHSGRYVEWARFLAKSGWSVYAVDHRGHGRSDGPRLWMDHYSDLVGDFCSLVEAGSAEWPDLPIFTAGMSMGGGIAVQAIPRLQKSVPNYSGTILIAPGLAVNPKMYPSPVLRRFLLFIDHIVPRLRVIRPKSSLLSNSPEILEEFRHDPYVCRCRIPIHFGIENLHALTDCFEAAPKITKPILICQGKSDLIVYPPRVAEFFNAVASSDKTIKLYEGIGHDVIHENTDGQVWDDILGWLASRIPAGK